MEETVTIGIAFRGHRDSVPLYRDSVPLHRDSVPPAPLKPAPTHAFSEANRPLPFFTLLLLAVSVRKFQMSDKCGAPPWGSPTFGGSPSPKRSRLRRGYFLVGGTPRTQVHEPQRGKPLASPMHRLRLRLAGGKRVSLALHSRERSRCAKLLNPSTRERQT